MIFIDEGIKFIYTILLLKFSKKILKEFKFGYIFSTIVIFISFQSLNLSDNPPNGWQYQSIPFVINNIEIIDMCFVDSLTGYAVTSDRVSGSDTEYVLKTTNAGNNWFINLSRERDFARVIFLNTDTGFVLHGDEILRTTNAGINWNNMPVPPDNFGFDEICPISYDTMWIGYAYIGGYFLDRTTNAGLNWIRQYNGAGMGAVNKIYMLNGRFGFAGDYKVAHIIKTTNSGINWIPVAGNSFTDMYFIDTLTGWKCRGDMKKTTDGGETWINQPLPNGPSFIFSSMEQFSVINKDTIWGGGGVVLIGNQFYGVLYRTTDGGANWAYQIPDTSYHIYQYDYINFLNKRNGWAYNRQRHGGIYSNNGGDTNFITFSKNEFETIPESYILNQNYPNPFNPNTIISYTLRKSGNITIKVYNLLGKEISVLVNQKQSAGSFKVVFNGKEVPSGIYFYSLFINNERKETKKMILTK